MIFGYENFLVVFVDILCIDDYLVLVKFYDGVY